jgi:hypothetical protein
MSLRPSLSLITLLLVAPLAPAQVALPVNPPPVAASAENSRLRQTETIYQLQLRTKHIPILSQYITDLQKLASQSADPTPYQKEIARIQNIISIGGVVDLAAAVQTLKTPAEMPVTQPPPMPVRVSRAVLSLTPALANRISPTPATSAAPEAAAIGEMEWRIETLPAGTYDIVLSYACPKLEQPLTVELTLNGTSLKTTFNNSHITPDATAYRLLRLGRITLTTETRGEILRIQAGLPSTQILYLRHLLITRVQPSPN